MHSHGFTQNWPPCRVHKNNKCSQCLKIWPWSTPQKSSQSPCFLSRSSSMGENQINNQNPTQFQQKFLLNASPELSQNTKYILHFLLAATGYDASQDITTQPPTSQLAIQMEALPFDPVLTHWATNQFVGLWQIA